MLLSPTVQREKEADGVLGNPLADTVARALLDAGDEGSVVDDAVEYLAPGRLGRAHGRIGLAGPGGKSASAHGGAGAVVAMGKLVAAMGNVMVGGRGRILIAASGLGTTGAACVVIIGGGFAGRSNNPFVVAQCFKAWAL